MNPSRSWLGRGRRWGRHHDMDSLLDRINDDIDRLDSALLSTSAAASPGGWDDAASVTPPVSPTRDWPLLDEREPPPSRRPGSSLQAVDVGDPDAVVSMLARAFQSSELCDVSFILRAPGARASTSGASDTDEDRVDAMGAIVAAQSPGLKALIYGDWRAGWFGASSPNGMRAEKAECVIDLPAEQFSVSSPMLPFPGLAAAARGGESSGPWSGAEFRRLVRFCHTGQVTLAPGAPETLALALCAEHFGVAALTDICSRFIRHRLAAWEPLLCAFLQSICGVEAFATLEEAVCRYTCEHAAAVLGEGRVAVLSEALLCRVVGDVELAMGDAEVEELVVEW
jgi:hypothetical protein